MNLERERENSFKEKLGRINKKNTEQKNGGTLGGICKENNPDGISGNKTQ